MSTNRETTKKFVEIPRADRKRYVSCIPLPTPVKTRLVQEFDSWVAHSGHEWAVSRMKEFRLFIMKRWSGENQYPHPGWFATNRHGVLTGNFGFLYKLSQQNHKQFQAVCNLLGIYTTVTYAEVLYTDPDGVLDSIESEVPKSPKLQYLKSKTLKGMLRRFNLPELFLREPEALSVVPPGKPSHMEQTPYDVWQLSQYIQFLPRTLRLLGEKAVGGERLAQPMFKIQVDRINAGDIHVTNEPGLKMRYFASPNKAWQRASEPLKNGLFDVLKDIPWDCTLDQRKADSRISQFLKQGKTVYSVDLASATDRFPYWFQELVLEALKPQKNRSQSFRWRQQRDLLRLMVEKGTYSFYGKRTYMWKTGQPLGLNPSFPLFTLSHGVLLLLLNGGKWNKMFYVLGDDVIIFDKSLHKKYRDLLQSWEVPVSENKSFSSSRLAQFAGLTYTPYGNFWLPKWNELTRSTLIDIAAFWYEGFTKGLRDQALIEQVLSLPEPYGIGRNPKGIPLSGRLTYAIVSKLEEIIADRLDKPKLSSTRLYNYLTTERGHYHSYLWKQDWNVSFPDREIPLKSSPYFGTTYISSMRSYLMDQTEVTGYPRLRLNSSGKRNPYTLGRTQFWNKLFQELDGRY